MSMLGPSFARLTTTLPTILLLLSSGWLVSVVRGEGEGEDAAALVSRYCFDCHGSGSPEAGMDLERLVSADTFAVDYRAWRNVATQLEQARMPPPEGEKPAAAERRRLVDWIDAGVAAAARRHEGDPGRVVMRRLTGAEYGYAIRDLTGIDLNLESILVDDAVGGAGFTNTGIVQFTQETTIERYLEAARHVADHAVVGTGPLSFHADPGRTGLELSAIGRIQEIYRANGFRAAAGEGGKAFGLEMYAKAFLAAWRYRYRDELGRPDATFESLGKEVGIGARFVEYIHDVVTDRTPSFPLSEVVEAWGRLPVPAGVADRDVASPGCDRIAGLLRDWQNRFGTNTDAKEEAPVLRADLFDVDRIQPFEMNVNWPEGTESAHLVFTVESANRSGTPDAVVIWKQVRIQFRNYDKRLEDPRPLLDFLKPETVGRLAFGRHPRGGRVGPGEFVTVGTKPAELELPIPEGARSARLLLTAELDVARGEDCTVRCTIAQLEETDQGKSVSGLLSRADSPAFERWKEGVLEFARVLPQVSHREPAPSDRDPIPAPVDNSYNNAERNFFHSRIKYYRDDRFLVENMLSDDARRRLDQAWTDLLGAFDFHDTWLRFLADKYGFDLAGRGFDDLSDDDLEEDWFLKLPATARDRIEELRTDYHGTRELFKRAEAGHVSDVSRLAAAAWRRPLSSAEVADLRANYAELRSRSGLDHPAAVRALIARVLVSPRFLYRVEPTGDGTTGVEDPVRALSRWELASRLSFLLWSSLPDEQLRSAASAGELDSPERVVDQARRMLRDPKSRRFSVEFFGQWFGFYRFDQFRGIDPERFPEFSGQLRQSLYDEAVEFFDFIVRNDRPVDEILWADYSFLNGRLASHYGIDDEVEFDDADRFRRIDGASRFHRGGLLRLGAVLATTSAPRRTSPVKRGDWILRRVLGTAVPPPPADAGSIAADEVVADGLSMRQRLEAHRREQSCRNCHSRFDALGFALENYDPLGRWRDRYRNDRPVETSGTLRDGAEIVGNDGLDSYLAERKPEFHRTFARKLIGFALGRSETVGDLPLVQKLVDRMRSGDGMRGLMEEVVASPQFRHHRAGDRATPGDEADAERELNDGSTSEAEYPSIREPTR